MMYFSHFPFHHCFHTPPVRVKNRFLPMQTIRQTSCPASYTLISGGLKNSSMENDSKNGDVVKNSDDNDESKPNPILKTRHPHVHYR